MSGNSHSSRVAEQLAMAEADGDEPTVIEVPITLHLNEQGLFVWIDRDEVDKGLRTQIADADGGVEEIERRLFNRIPDVLLDNIEERLPTEGRRMDEDAPVIGCAEFYPESDQIGGVTITLDQRAQWKMMPRPDGRGKR